MRTPVRIARYLGCGLLIAAGGLAWLLMLLILIVNDEDDVRITAAILFVLATAIVVGGLRWLPKRTKVQTAEPAAPPPELSSAAARAFEQLRRGESIVLYPRRWRWAILLAITAALFAGSVLMFVGMPHVLPAAGILLFGAGTVLSVIQFVPRWSHLRIAPDGLVLRNSARTTRLAWNDIEQFSTYEVYHQYGSVTMVGYDRRDLTPGRQSFFQTLTRGMTGVDGSLPDSYGMRHEQLADLLNEARDRYATEHGPSPSLLADLELQRRAAAVRRDRIPVVTVALTIVCIAAFVMEVSNYGVFPTAQELGEGGGASRAALSDGDWWTLLSANVLHANPIHILLNLIALLVLGVLLEREVGWVRFGALCLVGGLASMSLAVLVGGAVVVGVSGVVYAVAAWALLRDVHRTRGLGFVAWAVLPIGVVYTFLVPGVSIGAHLGGLLAGLGLGYLFEHLPARGPEPIGVRAP
jgi:membrane associated rhomboid family serine protease